MNFWGPMPIMILKELEKQIDNIKTDMISEFNLLYVLYI